MRNIFILIGIAVLMSTGVVLTTASIHEDAPAVAPDFTLPDTEGQDFTLSSLRGQYVVLDFWGTWCKICLKGMPKLKEAQEKYKGKFTIVGVDCGDKTVKWKHWVDSLKDDMPWKHVIMGRRLEVQARIQYKRLSHEDADRPRGQSGEEFCGRGPKILFVAGRNVWKLNIED